MLEKRHTHRRNLGKTSGRRKIHSKRWEAVEHSETDFTKQEILQSTLGQMLSKFL